MPDPSTSLKTTLDSLNAEIGKAVSRVQNKRGKVNMTSQGIMQLRKHSETARFCAAQARKAYIQGDSAKAEQILQDGHDAYAECLLAFKKMDDSEGVKAAETAILTIEDFLKSNPTPLQRDAAKRKK